MKTLPPFYRPPTFFFILIMLVFHQATFAQSISTITPETISAKISEVEAATELDEATKTKLIWLYQKTLSRLEAARSNRTTEKEYRNRRQSAPIETDAVSREIKELEKGGSADKTVLSKKTPITELEQQLLKEKAKRATLAARISDADELLTIEQNRPYTARHELTEASSRQEEIAVEIKLPPAANESPLLTEARNWALQSENLALMTKIKVLDQELLGQPSRIELLKAQIEKSTLLLENSSAKILILEDLLRAKRLASAEQAIEEAEEAKKEAVGEHPLVQKLAEFNSVLSEELSALTAELEKIENAATNAGTQTDRLSEDFKSTQQKLEIAGLSQALGQVLLEQSRALPNTRLLRNETKGREKEIAQAGLQQIRHEEELRQLRNVKSYVNNMIASLTLEEADSIRSKLEALANSRQQLLDKAWTTDQALLRALGELDFEQRQLLDKVESYNEFLTERLLWIRSAPLLTYSVIKNIPLQIGRLLAPEHWVETVKSLLSLFTTSVQFIVGLGIFIVLLLKGRKLRHEMLSLNKNIHRVTTDRFLYPFRALILSLLLATTWPLFLAVTGWQLSFSPHAGEFVKALSGALVSIAIVFFYLEALRQIILPGGLAAAHFKWPEASLKKLRHDLKRLMLTFLPATYLALVVLKFESPALGAGIGRLAFIIVLVTLGLNCYRLLRPNKGVLHAYLTRHPSSMVGRLRYILHITLIGFPLILIALALTGYLYTATTLTLRLIDTLCFFLVLLVMHQLVIRWLLLTQRRLAYKAALEKREAIRAAAAENKDSTQPQPGTEGVQDIVEEPSLDIAALNQGTRELLNTALIIAGGIGIWLIWSELLPAFGIFNEITLWDYTETIAGQEKRASVTLINAGMAAFIVAVTVVATKRLPILLEFVLLQHLNMSSGGHYAATTLSRYVIIAIGILSAFSTIGASWSQIQWLAAALSVGIGFGLQEIVANFISGIIILFERPIRVGDVVTVGDTDGVVTRIQIRATTIRNWDRKELLVPNKEFITSRLLNWSLSDQTTRILIPVGVAYGTDVKRAMALITWAAVQNSNVLKDPTPVVTFESFGDNALLLYLRAFVGSLDYRVATTSELHEAIYEKLNDAGIVFAYPQRDLHLDTLRPLDIRIKQDD